MTIDSKPPEEILATTELPHSLDHGNDFEKAALANRLDDLGIKLNNVSFERVNRRIEAGPGTVGDMTDAQLQTVIEEAVAGTEILAGVVESFR